MAQTRKTTTASRPYYKVTAKVIGPDDDAGRVFKFELAYCELREHPKFLMGPDKAEPKFGSVADARVDTGSSEDSMAEKVKVKPEALRPIGR